MKRTALLMITAITPCLIQAMDSKPGLIQAVDKPAYNIPQSIITHREQVSELCFATYLMLQNFKADQKRALSKLAKVASLTQSLTLASPSVPEREIGFHIYQTNPKLDFLDSLKAPFSHTGNNIKTAIFFYHLAQYNANLRAKTLVSPDKITIFNFLKQQKIEAIVSKNAQRGLIIPEQTVKEKIIPAKSSVGITEFMSLARIIEDFLKDSPEEMRDTVELFYHKELTGQKPANS